MIVDTCATNNALDNLVKAISLRSTEQDTSKAYSYYQLSVM